MRPAWRPLRDRVDMTYTATTRDRYRLAVSAVTGLATVGILATTGWLTGSAASDYAADQARKANAARAEQQAYRQARAEHRAAVAASRAAAQPGVALRPRPQVTRTTVQYVQGTASGAVGAGGQISSGSTSESASASAPAPAPAANSGPAPAPAPPPPPAPPAPSSGS